MKIRKATLNDAKACHEMSNIPELLSAAGEQIGLGYFKDIIESKNTVVLVGEIDGKVIGYVHAELISSNGAMGTLLCVQPDFRNNGYGKELMDELENKLKKMNVRFIIGYAPKSNKKTLNFHKNNGYIIGEEMVEILKYL